MRPTSAFLRDEINRFDPDIPIDRAWMPPSTWYTDPELFALEKRILFPHTWQPVARVADIQEPGSYISGCFANTPWVVVRGEDGALHAFHNVCSHKGREVVTGAGKAEESTLVCGYHAWRYSLTGRLTSAPRIAGIQDFDRDAMALRPLNLEVWGPWVFIHTDLQATPITTRLAHLNTLLTRSGWSNLTFHSEKSWLIHCNWKAYIDNYLDGGYHIPHMHPTLDAQLDMDTYRTELFDTYSIQTSDAAPETDARIDYDPADRIGDGAIYAWIHPNFMINRYGPCLDTNYVVPVAHNACRVHYQFFFDASVAGALEFIEQSIEQADITQREDIEICESVQVGLQSPAYDRGRYAPRVEIGEHHFHQLLARTYRQGLP